MERTVEFGPSLGLLSIQADAPFEAHVFEYEVTTSAVIDWKGTNDYKEVDHLIIRDEKVVGYAETKNSVTDDALSDANEQLSKTRTNLNTFGVSEINSPKGELDIEMSPETIDSQLTYTIGGTTEFDIQSVDPETVTVLYEAFK